MIRAEEATEKRKIEIIIGGIEMEQSFQRSGSPSKYYYRTPEIPFLVHLNQTCIHTTLYVNIHGAIIYILDGEAADFH